MNIKQIIHEIEMRQDELLCEVDRLENARRFLMGVKK